MRSAPLIRLAAVAAVAALALTSCSAGAPEPAASSGGAATAPLLTIGSLTEPTSWDPAQSNEGHFAPIYQSVYDTLLKREPDGTLSPMLATEWTMSDDSMSLSLELRTDVTFTDGSVFDGEAVKANIEHFKTANGPQQGNLAAIESVEVVDADTVNIQLSAPDPDLPNNLANSGGYMASPAALATPEITTVPVGSGPYVLDTSRSVVGSTIMFTRNEDYWGEELPFDEVEFKILTDETARLNALTSGQIDFASLNRAASALQAQAAGLNAPEPFSVNWGGLLFFDRDGALLPELADVRVREALAIAIDADAIVQVGWEGLGTQTSQVFGPDTEAYEKDLDDAYAYDPKRAKELLAEAGASDLSLTLPVSGVFEPVIYDAIIQNWEDIGVTVTRHQWGPGEAIPSMQRGEFPIAFMTLASRSDWGTMNFLLSPEATWNPLGSTDPELEALMAGYPSADEAGKAEIAREVNEWVIDNVWFAPIMRPDTFNFYGDSIEIVPQVQQAIPSIWSYTPTGM
ncbi:ABC transporter substrate-binding protein [Microbacterium murale]|uniref:Peptide/nickel transport system substrate-binding protein n=1 Tax=Microbacterium murale TaxID=1081040 RepID=A0ABU0PBA0_9MICO|nr:ABC transporter substrate-binding protein [Microbacterium murale]MDQ0644217.1 peptide/nickel transport system substrate-binding protein [Microbacterium murale]